MVKEKIGISLSILKENVHIYKINDLIYYKICNKCISRKMTMSINHMSQMQLARKKKEASTCYN